MNKNVLETMKNYENSIRVYKNEILDAYTHGFSKKGIWRMLKKEYGIMVSYSYLSRSITKWNGNFETKEKIIETKNREFESTKISPAKKVKQDKLNHSISVFDSWKGEPLSDLELYGEETIR